ncbi:MAG: hypothetical protein LBI82_10995 [Dysgonamonadaceae bacterium]|jgi:hypothetical protein|nr:hypothetical protein [Dysgonamonadaceae bacterium]
MKSKVLILLAALSFAAVVAAQGTKTMYIMKKGGIAYQSAVSSIDSIIFYNPYPDITETLLLLTGGSEKTWTWDGGKNEVFGNGAYLSDTQPSWWGCSATDISTQTETDGIGASMTFSATGAMVKTWQDNDTKVFGTFSIDMTKTKMNAEDTDIWSIGKFYTDNVTVLMGKKMNRGEGPIYEYDIIKLNATELVLAWPEDGDSTGAWGACWFWMFKAK